MIFIQKLRNWKQKLQTLLAKLRNGPGNRDGFAAQAMQGLIIASQNQGYLRDTKTLATEAYRIADAMIERRAL